MSYGGAQRVCAPTKIMSKRLPQVNSLLQTELSQIFLRELELPRDCLVTITAVKTSPDLHDAIVWISVLPETETPRILKILTRKVGLIQKVLHSRLVMKPLPKLEFRIDSTEAEASRIEQILDNLK